jgi:hypothetical protein
MGMATPQTSCSHGLRYSNGRTNGFEQTRNRRPNDAGYTLEYFEHAGSTEYAQQYGKPIRLIGHAQ